MKKIPGYYLLFAILLMATLPACDKNFKQINTSVDFVSTPNIDYELPYIELTMLDKNYYSQTYYAAAYAGQINTNVSFPAITAYKETEMSEHWVWVYKQPLKTAADMIDQCKNDPSRINYLSIGRILRAYLFQSLTDSYGDLPYFDGLKGYSDQMLTPKYDAQQDIYADLLKEVDEAATALTPSKSTPVISDIVYAGDVTKWKKFAYSLMLRMALRISKADPVTAKTWITKAIAGGLMTSNADNFVVKYTTQVAGTGTTSNGTAHTWISSSYITTYRLAQSFVDSLKNRNDPRTSIYCMREKLPLSFYQEGDHNPANQRGRRQFDNITQRDSCSVANIKTMGRYDAPIIFLSFPQVQFELAECVVRGIITGDAKSLYETGVRNAMTELSIYGADGWNASSPISTAQQDAYLLANPYVPADALKLINTQYWIETFPNYFEGWANMRRSGFPDVYSSLDLTLSSNLGAKLPRRLYYPQAEASANPAHLAEAIARQGADLTSTRVWWDKP